MIPLRSQIRHAVMKRLKDCPRLEGRVFDTPIHAFNPTQLPLLVVNVEKDHVLDDWTSILATTGARNALIHMHELSFSLKILAKATEQVADPFDSIASEIITALLSDSTLDGLCKDIRFNDLSEVTVSEEGEQPVSTMTLQCSVWYRVVERMPDKTLA